MDRYQAEVTISESGGLRLDHLPFEPGERVEVTVDRPRRRRKTWPKGFFEATFGSIRDDSFVRHPQGEFEAREPMR